MNLETDTNNDVYNESCQEIIRDNCEFHCVCFQNDTKHQNMKTRFNILGLNLHIYEGVPHTDSRIIATNSSGDYVANRVSSEEAESPLPDSRQISPVIQRLWSVTYGHLDMIQFFLNSGKQFGIFCEDDIVINRTLPMNLPHIMSECTEMGTECLLLGYMKTYKVEGWMSGHETIRAFPERPYTYHAYPNDQWGVHLYMLSRSGAKKILDTYAYSNSSGSKATFRVSSEGGFVAKRLEPQSGSVRFLHSFPRIGKAVSEETDQPPLPNSSYADTNINDPTRPFSPDWTITKCPGLKRALISPMFACEDGRDSYDHYAHDGQYNFHMETFRFNYVPDLFI